ncbi:MAG: hypothetical protein QXW04_00295 [Candidatus Aenigmatarchaeota archaeon]
MILKYFVLINFLFLTINITLSQIYLELQILISKEGDISLSTYYFYSGINIIENESESINKMGKIEISIFDENEKKIKSIYLDYTEDEFFEETFDLIRGKRIEKYDFIVKNVIINLPNNSKILKIYNNNREVESYLIDLKNLKLFKSHFENQKDFPIKDSKEEKRDFLFKILIIFCCSLIALILIIYFVFKRRRVPSANYQ